MSWGKTLQGMLQAVEAAQAGGTVAYRCADQERVYWRLGELSKNMGALSRCASGCDVYILEMHGGGRIDVVPMGGG